MSKHISSSNHLNPHDAPAKLHRIGLSWYKTAMIYDGRKVVGMEFHLCKPEHNNVECIALQLKYLNIVMPAKDRIMVKTLAQMKREQASS